MVCTGAEEGCEGLGVYSSSRVYWAGVAMVRELLRVSELELLLLYQSKRDWLRNNQAKTKEM